MSDEFEGAKRGRKTIEKKRLSVRLDPDVYSDLMAYIDKKDYITSKLVEKILKAFLDTRDDK
jgi:hypothetical protein